MLHTKFNCCNSEYQSCQSHQYIKKLSTVIETRLQGITKNIILHDALMNNDLYFLVQRCFNSALKMFDINTTSHLILYVSITWHVLSSKAPTSWKSAKWRSSLVVFRWQPFTQSDIWANNIILTTSICIVDFRHNFQQFWVIFSLLLCKRCQQML